MKKIRIFNFFAFIINLALFCAPCFFIGKRITSWGYEHFANMFDFLTAKPAYVISAFLGLMALIIIPFNIASIYSGKVKTPKAMLIIKLVLTTITFAVFAFNLYSSRFTPVFTSGFEILTIYALVPLLAFINFAFFETGKKFAWGWIFFALISALFYAVFYIKGFTAKIVKLLGINIYLSTSLEFYLTFAIFAVGGVLIAFILWLLNSLFSKEKVKKVKEETVIEEKTEQDETADKVEENNVSEVVEEEKVEEKVEETEEKEEQPVAENKKEETKETTDKVEEKVEEIEEQPVAENKKEETEETVDKVEEKEKIEEQPSESVVEEEKEEKKVEEAKEETKETKKPATKKASAIKTSTAKKPATKTTAKTSTKATTTDKKPVAKTTTPQEKKEDSTQTKTETQQKAVAKKPENKEQVLYKEKSRVYHISKNEDGKWQVKLANGEKAIKLFDTQLLAINYAKELVKTRGGSIRIHSLKGKIRK